MKQLIEKYALVYGKRYTRSQKDRFMDELIKDIHPFCASIELLKTKKQLNNSTHILINEPKDKKLIVVASYDTLSRALLQSTYYPFNNTKNRKNAQKEWLITLVLSALMLLMMANIVFFGIIQSKHLFIQVVSVVVFLIGGFLSFNLVNGTANVVNYNRNSVAVCLLVDLIKEGHTNNIGFILLDYATDSFKGFKELNTIINTNSEIIYLNCIADGEMVAIARKSQNKANEIKLESDTKVIYKTFSDKEAESRLFSLFPNLTEIVCGCRIGNDFVVVNGRSNKDYHINMKQVTSIKQALLKRIKEQYENIL